MARRSAQALINLEAAGLITTDILTNVRYTMQWSFMQPLEAAQTFSCTSLLWPAYAADLPRPIVAD